MLRILLNKVDTWGPWKRHTSLPKSKLFIVRYKDEISLPPKGTYYLSCLKKRKSLEIKNHNVWSRAEDLWSNIWPWQFCNFTGTRKLHFWHSAVYLVPAFFAQCGIHGILRSGYLFPKIPWNRLIFTKKFCKTLSRKFHVWVNFGFSHSVFVNGDR